MEIRYEYQPGDFGPLMRQNGYWRMLGWIVVLLGATVFPSLVALWLVGLRSVLTGGLVAFAFLILSMNWMLVRTTRKNFLKRANDHVLTLHDHFLEHEANGRWHRSNGRWITDIKRTPKYVIIQRGPQAALIPRRHFEGPQQEEQFVAGLRALADESPPHEPPLREIEGPHGMSVEFEYSERELNDLAQQRFVLREGRGSIWWLVILLLALIWALSPSLTATAPQAAVQIPKIVGVILALLLPIAVWMLLAPLRRRINRLPREVHTRQRISLWSGGMEHSGEHFQSFLEWSHLTRVLDGRDYIVLYGDTGGWSAVPRRAFENRHVAQEFCDEAMRKIGAIQDADDEESLDPLPPHVETGNPYQPPSGSA